MNDVTRLLQRFREGDRDVMDELVPLLYPELRRIAGSFMHRQPPGHTLQPTALVNEAFIKLFGGAQPQFNDRAHFLALTSRVMWQVLLDHAPTAPPRKSAAATKARCLGTRRSTSAAMPAIGRSSCCICTGRSRLSNVRVRRWRRSWKCSTSAG